METLIRRKTIYAGTANTLVDISLLNPPYPGTAMSFTGYTWEMEINTKADGTGTKLASATVTITANRIVATLTVAQSNAVVAGAVNGVVYSTLLGAASGAEPVAFVDLTCPVKGIATVWGVS